MFFTLFLTLLLPLFALAGVIVPRDSEDLAARQSYSDARFTWYQTGLGACGQTNQPSDFVVALDSSLYGSGYPGPECFKSITIQANGQTATAQIVDECPGCPEGGLDMSEGLFTYFADPSLGVLYGTWWYN